MTRRGAAPRASYVSFLDCVLQRQGQLLGSERLLQEVACPLADRFHGLIKLATRDHHDDLGLMDAGAERRDQIGAGTVGELACDQRNIGQPRACLRQVGLEAVSGERLDVSRPRYRSDRRPDALVRVDDEDLTGNAPPRTSRRLYGLRLAFRTGDGHRAVA